MADQKEHSHPTLFGRKGWPSRARPLHFFGGKGLDGHFLDSPQEDTKRFLSFLSACQTRGASKNWELQKWGLLSFLTDVTGVTLFHIWQILMIFLTNCLTNCLTNFFDNYFDGSFWQICFDEFFFWQIFFVDFFWQIFLRIFWWFFLTNFFDEFFEECFDEVFVEVFNEVFWQIFEL